MSKRLNNAQWLRKVEEELGLQGRNTKQGLRLYRGFYYTPKESREDWAARVLGQLEAHGFDVSYVGTDGLGVEVPFKGGAPVHKQSHYCLIITRND